MKINSKAGKVKPRAAKPYRVADANGKKTIVREYLYFNSVDTWKRASASSDFQRWAKSVRFTKRKGIAVEERPYMRPALTKETTLQKMNARFTRAFSRV